MASSQAEHHPPPPHHHRMEEIIRPPPLLHRVHFLLLVLLSYLLWLRLLFFLYPPSSPPPPLHSASDHRPTETCDPDIAPFYVLPIHPRFNAALVNRCLSPLVCCHVCSYVGHRGLGRPLLRIPGGGDAEGTPWYATHPSAAEMLFHARVERHPCRTMQPEEATLFYVPIYAGLHAALAGSRPGNRTLRNSLPVELAAHLSSLHAFRRNAGRDHFLVIGRPSRDFMLSPDHHQDTGALDGLLLPEVANMTVLTVERHPREGGNQVAIPYPSYFHPRTAAEVSEWQTELRRFGRTRLFAFVGGAGTDYANKTGVRSRILRQCRRSDRCLSVRCSEDTHDCDDPDRVLSAMREADFCLQPPGRSSFTGRSTFDAVLAGCIPVFFSEQRSAYTQYEWYGAAGGLEKWSVLLKRERWNGIEEELARIPRAKVERMREEVIGLIPRLAYAHPDAKRSELGFRDAVDVALVELSKRVRATTTTLPEPITSSE